jgi:hypothetical protein
MRVTGASYSSDKKLRRCEQQYSYRYDEKLKQRIKSKGLFMGNVMHILLESYRKGEKWVEAYKQWKASEWDKLFEEEREAYLEKKFSPELVLDLMTHYVEHWTNQQARWEPLFIEKDFELTTKSGLLIRFKMDYIVKDGKLTVLVENKNKKDLPDSNERILDPQVHMYCYLASKLPKPIIIDRIIWDYIRTEPVPMPSINKDGSISKRKLETDQRTYLRFLKENKIHPKSEEERLGIENHLRSLPETLTLARVMNRPNLRVGEIFVRDMVARAERAKTITRPTRNWDRTCSWMCDYKQLCEADMLGKPDRNAIIKKDFLVNIKGDS